MTLAGRARAALVSILVVLALVAPGAAFARSQGMENLRKYAGIVVDAKTGETLYQQNADEPRYPASITKVMTLYILFQELSAGHIKLSTEFTVSPYAASASPTKLGLKAGSKIAVEDIIKSIVTISANDMARVIAENIAGSEPAFARRMTATARALGMMHTVYYNASGLPDGRQRTTVRDQAILAAAIYEHFPQYYGYFQTRSFTYGRRTYGNHDYVLGFMGVDGLKTGYINAAGYNLMTASRQGNRHLIVVGFGFNTGGQRDATVRSLVAKYLPKAHQGQYVASALIRMPSRQQSAPTVMLASTDAAAKPAGPSIASAGSVLPLPAPDFRQDNAGTDDQAAVPEQVAYAPEPLAYPDDMARGTPAASVTPDSVEPMDIGSRPAVAAVSALGAPSSTGAANAARPDVLGQHLNNMLLGAPPAPLGQTRPSAPLLPPVGIGAGNEPIDLTTSGAVGHRVAETAIASAPAEPAPAPVEPAPPAAPAGSWIVQVGAAPTSDGASKLIAAATDKVDQLSDLRSYIERFDKGGQTFFRARFIGFGSEDAATGMCDRLKKAKLSCLAMQS